MKLSLRILFLKRNVNKFQLCLMMILIFYIVMLLWNYNSGKAAIVGIAVIFE